jgi:hypothetical protein
VRVGIGVDNVDVATDHTLALLRGERPVGMVAP